ncbi:beta-galactosidase [Oleiharenicola lentus]|uniref:beta-galactosidase n=1 Tax=Oleiharenicola lentus TaxID=2508720 RepID=UPI003F6628CC
MPISTQPARPRLSPANFLFGVAYYPEHDLPEHLEHDVERLLAAKVNVVRMAEFAWDRMERREGEFDFSFFDFHIDRLGRAGIKTILCTPTEAPPMWLTTNYPDVLQVDANGRSMQQGSRQHASLCSPRYRDFSRKITHAMATHFARNPHVIGWQTDNEIYCHTAEDYSPAAHVAFREFLSEKYRDIAALNEAWGTNFWAQTYTNFEEVLPPYAMRPSAENPGHRLDFLLFTSHKAVVFQRDQVEILRAANPAWWITHNGVFRNLDYREFSRDLDFMAVDVYPMLAFMDAPGELSPAKFPSRLLARTRSICGKFIVTELQSGPGGQLDWMSATPEPGQMRLFAWQGVAHGAEGILHFRWRTCRYGAEEYWEGVIDHDNVLRRRFEELCVEGAEFARLAPILRGTEVRPEVGVLFDMGLMEFGHRPITHGLPSPWDVADGIFTACSAAGLNVGYVHPLDSLEGCKLLFLCSNAIVTAEVVAALTRWVERGGTLVILARSGTKDKFGRVVAATPPGLLTALAGCTVKEHSRLNSPPLTGSPSITFKWDDQVFSENLWREVLETRGGAVVARWREGRFVDAAAAVENQVGEGRCFYIGTYASTELVSGWLALLMKNTSVKAIIPGIPPGVEVLRRTGEGKTLVFVLNHTAEIKKIANAPTGEHLLPGVETTDGVLTLPAFGVALIRS